MQKDKPSKNEILKKYPAGYRTKVKIIAIRPWGIIVDNGKGLKGIVHTRNLTVDVSKCDPSLVFKEGEMLDVEVIKYDKLSDRFVLSHREILLDKVWEIHGKKLRIGQIKKLEIRRISDKGAFVLLEGGIWAQIPLFHLSPKTIDRPKDAVHVGDTVVAKTIRIGNRELLRLSIRRL